MTRSYLEDFAAVSGESGRGPAWLADVRHRAIARFGVLGFPTTKNEDWHFTSVAPIAEREFEPLVGRGVKTEVSRADIAQHMFGGDLEGRYGSAHAAAPSRTQS